MNLKIIFVELQLKDFRRIFLIEIGTEDVHHFILERQGSFSGLRIKREIYHHRCLGDIVEHSKNTCEFVCSDVAKAKSKKTIDSYFSSHSTGTLTLADVDNVPGDDLF